MTGIKNAVGGTEKFQSPKHFKNFQLGVVITVGKVGISEDTKGSANRDRRFNADTHSIRVRIVGSKYDNRVPDAQLANCFPMIPKHLNIVPKVGEMVMVMVFGEDEKHGDRWYMGPIISSEEHLNKDLFAGTATSNLANGLEFPTREISNITTAKGLFENPQNVVIEGRLNTDIIQRPDEILLRVGKGKIEIEPTFNNVNPGYIQIKHGIITLPKPKFTLNTWFKTIGLDLHEEASVMNIVSNKINLLTYKGGAPEFDNLTNVNKYGVADYISDEQLTTILEEAHPLVFGDTLVEYLQLLRDALEQHCHNGNGNEWTDRTDRGTEAVATYLKEAVRLEKDMLSKNIRIN